MNIIELTKKNAGYELEHLDCYDGPIALDIETTGLDWLADSIVSAQVATPESVYYLDNECIVYLSAIPKNRTLVLHNFKFDYHFLREAGVVLQNPVRDTMLIHHLVDENASHRLDDIIQGRYGDNYKQVFWSQYKEFVDAPRDAQLEYACKDAYYTRLLYVDLLADCARAGIPDSLVEHVHRFALSLYESEARGVALDLDYVDKLGTELCGKTLKLREEIYSRVSVAMESVCLDLYAKELAKRKTERGRSQVPVPEFNLDSTRHLTSLLYEKLKLPRQFNQKTKAVTTDDAALSALSAEHPVVPLIQEYRGHQKIFTSFIEGTLEKQRNGRIYPSFNVNGTVTGRISSSNPNCLSMDTEIMTEDGWASYERVLNGLRVAAVNPNSGEISFETPDSVWVSDGSEKELVSFQNEHADWLVTSNHRCLLRDRKNGKYRVVAASALGGDWQIIHAANLVDSPSSLCLPEDVLRFCIAVQADGSIRTDCDMVDFSFSKDRKVHRLTALLDKLGLRYRVLKSPRRTRIYVYSCRNIIWSVLTHDKCFKPSLVQLSRRLREVFLEELFYWDGCFTRKNDYCSAVRANADVVQAIAAVTGIRAHLVDKPNAYRVFLTKRDYSLTANAKKSLFLRRSKVWCVRVSTGFILARRKSNTFVTGNCQQLPRNGGVRGMFIPEPGHRIVTCDYGQLEVVLAAHFSNDPVLLDLINSGKSMHDYTANALGITRQDAKAVNFGSIYGMSEYRLSSLLGTAVGRAKRILDKFWETYRGLKSAIDECHAKVDRGEPIVNPFGRQRHFDTTGADHNTIQRMKRQAFNSLVQGTGADITNRAFYLVSEHLKRSGWGTGLFPVHDEIIIGVKVTYAKEASEFLANTMIAAGKEIGLRVPLTVDCSEPLERWEK